MKMNAPHSLLNPAIVLGSNVNALGVIRSLGRMSIRCAAAASPDAGDFSRYSRYLSEFDELGNKATDKAILDVLADLSHRLKAKFPVIIPTSDRFSDFISKNQSTLSKEYLFNCADPVLYDTFLDKWKTELICRDHGILTPFTLCPQSLSELYDLTKQLPYPVIVKPRYTFDARFPGKNAIFSSRNEMISFFKAHQIIGKAIIQEVIPSGDGDILVVCGYSDRNGQVLALYSGRKLRQYKPDFGATCFGVSERQVALEESTTKFLNKIGYRGFSMAEFAVSRVDKRKYFLELNTRTSWPNQLYADAGVDLTQIGYLDIINKDYHSVIGKCDQKDGVIWLDFRRDFASYRIKRRQGTITFPTWLRSLFSARSFAWWSIGDPLPFLCALFWDLRNLTRALIRRLTTVNSFRRREHR